MNPGQLGRMDIQTRYWWSGSHVCVFSRGKGLHNRFIIHPICSVTAQLGRRTCSNWIWTIHLYICNNCNQLPADRLVIMRQGETFLINCPWNCSLWAPSCSKPRSVARQGGQFLLLFAHIMPCNITQKHQAYIDNLWAVFKTVCHPSLDLLHPSLDSAEHPLLQTEELLWN